MRLTRVNLLGSLNIFSDPLVRYRRAESRGRDFVGGRELVGGILVLFHRRFETTDTFSDSFAQLGKLLRSEHEQGNSKDYQQMCGMQESFKHIFPLILKSENIAVCELHTPLSRSEKIASTVRLPNEELSR